MNLITVTVDSGESRGAAHAVGSASVGTCLTCLLTSPDRKQLNVTVDFYGLVSFQNLVVKEKNIFC